MRRKLDVRISDEFDGSCTVWNESEPVFCFVRSSRDEAIALARETLADYDRRFGAVSAPSTTAPHDLRVIAIRHSEPLELDA